MLFFIFLTIVLSETAAFLPGFSPEEDAFMRKHIPKELLAAYEGLTHDDKILIYQRVIGGDIFTTLLTENERIVELSSKLVNVVGKKISRLDGKAKKLVIKAIQNLLGLVQRMAAGEELNLKHLAEQEQKRFRGLTQEERQQIQEQFPIFTSFGLFTNERLSKIVENLAAETVKAKEEL